jgi:hypothetical protein
MRVFTWWMHASKPGWYMNYVEDIEDFAEGVGRNLQERGPCALTPLDWN